MDEQIIFIIIAVAFWIFKAVFSNKDEKKADPQRNKPTNTVPKKKSFQEILEEMIKETSGEQRTAEPQKTVLDPTKTILKHTSKIEKQKQQLNWQEVDRTKLRDKAQLIYHEDYHDMHKNETEDKSIVPIEEIAKTEGKVYHFDAKKVNWKDAIIAKEILERKYV